MLKARSSCSSIGKEGGGRPVLQKNRTKKLPARHHLGGGGKVRAEHDDDDDEGRINFRVALSPKSTRTRNNKPKQLSHVIVISAMRRS